MSLAFFSPPPHCPCPSPFLSSSHFPSYHHPPTASFSTTATATGTGTGTVVAVAASSSSYSNSNSNHNSSLHNQKVSQSAIQRISDKLRRLGYVPPATDSPNSSASSRETDTERASTSPGEIFIPTPHRLPAYRLASTLEQQQIPRNEKKEAVPSVTELMVPPHELRRLRTLGIKLRTKIKIGKPGVTEGIVNGIHERWRRSEVVKIKCDDLCRINMRRTHDILETKTGGIVVWRSGSIIVLYRGPDYKYPYFRISRQVAEQSNVADGSKPDNAAAPAALIPGVGSQNLVRLQLPGEAKLAEEADRLLDGLGPRFSDWWGLDPKPVDGDLLPGVVVGFRKPFRVLPFGIKQRLTDSEMTTLRRLGRPLPCHFALGRNRNLQGLAQAMIKLWEKCEIAKIAIKKGVPDANSDTMIEELKKLTGGTLLSKDSECIVFYRGKDFLPLAVSTAIEERRKNINNSATVQEESHDERRISDHDSVYKETFFGENHEKQMDSVVINKLEEELSLAIRKKEKAEKLLEELENSSGSPREGHDEKEAISEEERYMLRKVGLSMKAFLLMGRKGVFDGTVENMHLHWKYRELVKIISKEKDIKEVEHAARILESESGGILVAVERVSKGYAIIIYRGKNYQRPKTLRPKSLPSKREAMKRSLQAQRRQSLKLHVLSLARNIEKLKQLMDKDESSSSPALPNSSSHMEDSEGPISSGNNEVEDPEESSEDDIEDSYWAPSLAAGEEASVTNPKLVNNIQPTDIQPGEDTYPTSGASSIDEKHSGEADNDEVPFKPPSLSNKERLILRKQALKMRNRPVLAVGRNNVITGVAKTIKTHFQKYPLAIVNIKNRADGTSVQQLISELEEATGSVMVSREPNKVILYRGWQHGENPVDKKKEDDHPTKSSRENEDTISPELMEAIRVECGFHPSEEEG